MKEVKVNPRVEAQIFVGLNTVKPRTINYAAKAKNRLLRKMKNQQARHMRKVA